MMNPVSVALISPFSSGTARGNITTVGRIAGHLPQAGCTVTVLPLDTTLPDERITLLNTAAPDLLHAFHANYGGPVARSLAAELGIPYLITITGSDLFDPELCSKPSTGQAIRDAAAVTCFDALVASRLAEAFPDAAAKITVIHQGVAPLPAKEPFPRAGDEFIILLPAAIRPVKGISDAIEALTPLAKAFPALRLLLAGGALDTEYAAEVGNMIVPLPWVRMLGEVPHQRMGDLYAASDLVLNCSLFEGGMANTVLEAMSMGKPVLARNVLGNRSLIDHGRNGWLFNTHDELRKLVKSLLLDPGQGIRTGEAGRVFVQENCTIQKEITDYVDVYMRILGKNAE